jgi:hypothetical protein
MDHAQQRPTPQAGQQKPKILGIGLSRTGTTSLTSALELLGFHSIHYPTSLEQIVAHAGATDITVSLTYRELDKQFPGSRFIVTMRPLEPWLISCEQLWKKNAEFFARSPLVMAVEKKIYGGNGYDRQRYIDARDRHHAAIHTYFRTRHGDLLYLDLFNDPDPWRTLCPFLDLAVPKTPFPHQNSSDAVDRILYKFLDKIDDCGELARITTMSESYIRNLRDNHPTPRTMSPLRLGNGFEQIRIIKWSCAALGSEKIAKLLDLEPGQIDNYLHDHNG